MQTIDSFFTDLEDGKAVRLALHMQDRSGKERFNCIYQKTTPPHFSLLFPPNSLPEKRIDTHRKSEVLIDLAGQNISLIADIVTIDSKQKLTLKGIEMINHDQLREFFRVDIATPVVASSLAPEELVESDTTWSMQGDTIDVSASGLLCLFPEPLKIGQQVRTKLVLPKDEPEVVQVIATVIRCSKIEDQAYHVALHYDSINSTTRDKIMGSCFEIQRKHLRLKVQVRNPE